MALPDYTSTGNADWTGYGYRGYRQATPRDQRADMMNRRQFRQYKKNYTPTPVNPTLPPQAPGYQGQVQEPAYDNSHPFFDPGSNYATTGSPYGQLRQGPGGSAMNLWAGDNPQAYYYATLNERGLGGLDARSQAAQGMSKDVILGYQAAKTKNMELQLPEYLRGWDPNSVLDQMSEEQLGIDRSRFTGRDRWGMRGGQ